MTTETEKPPATGISRRDFFKYGLALVAGSGFLNLLGNAAVAIANSEKLTEEFREKAEQCNNLRSEASQAYVEGDIPRAQTIFKSPPYQEACFQKEVVLPAEREKSIKLSEEKAGILSFLAKHPLEVFGVTSGAMITFTGFKMADMADIKQKTSTGSPPTPHL